jgi:hypothetical protein
MLDRIGHLLGIDAFLISREEETPVVAAFDTCKR